jgi:hypothetical protein
MTVDEDRSVVVTFAGICRIGTAGTIHIVIYILIMILCLTYLESKGGDVVAMKVEEKLMQLPCPSQASLLNKHVPLARNPSVMATYGKCHRYDSSFTAPRVQPHASLLQPTDSTPNLSAYRGTEIRSVATMDRSTVTLTL